MILCLSIAVHAQGQIDANFTSSATSACNSLQTTFIDQSTSTASIIGWLWDINGNTSQEQNPGALFTEAGTYTICLTVTDVNGLQDQECKTDYITIYPNPVAAFEVDNTEGCAPVTVTFSDNSFSENGVITSWLWSVGGSAGVVEASTGSDVTSTYTIPGQYTSSLTVIDERGCSATSAVTAAVTANSLVVPDIVTALQPTCELPWNIDFTNLSADPTISYTWNFGNGQTFTGAQPPTITYEEVGIYDITIAMSAGTCADTIVLTEFIDTNSPARIEVADGPHCQGDLIAYTDISVNEADMVLWDFGDGTTSSEDNPIHAYDEAGCYDVMLIRTVGPCVDTAVMSCVTVLPAPVVTYDIENQFACILPAEVVLHAEGTDGGSLRWSFGEDSFSESYDTNDVNITIDDFGSYMARLEYTATNGCNTIVDSILIDIKPFEVDLPVQTISGCRPLVFDLVDSISSQVDIQSYLWTVGDGTYMSTSATPSFSIPDTGRYDVQLIAQNVDGCIDTVVVEDYVSVGMLPVVNFSATPLISCIEEPKNFTNLSSSFTNSWVWYFDNNPFSELENPTYGFGTPGIYDIALYASHNGCTDSIRLDDYIEVLEPFSSFVVDYNCEDPYTISVENRSIGADSLAWTLYLSDTDSLMFADSIFADFTFADRGVYRLKHYSKSFDTGCEHSRTDTIRIVDPVASYVIDTLRGCAPLELQIGDFSQDAFSYEFVSDIANIDSIFSAEPTVIFDEGGILTGPLLIITDIHECRDSFQLMDSVSVNKLVAQVVYDNIICLPGSAQLLDASTTVLADIVSWQWEVSPLGYQSSDQNTSVDIEDVGFYDVSLSVMDAWGCTDTLFIPQAIEGVGITPDFTYDTLGCAWAPIRFRSSGENGYTVTYLWDFGDGNTSTAKSPNHTYTTEGVYSVCLTMSDVRGCDKIVCKDNVVRISNPTAAFVGDPASATCPPLLTAFDNQSINSFSYRWDFGDNSGISSATSPSHVYTAPGRYDVRLIATSTPFCEDTLTLPEYIQVEGPVGDFLSLIDSTCIPLGIELQAASDGFYSYVWDLGNGILDSVDGLVIVDTLTYEYDIPGRYTPKLIITDSAGCTRSFAGDPIVVDEVELDFTMDSNPICGPPLTISLENLSDGSTDDVDYFWFISGPETITSTERDPAIDLTVTGLYDVSLIATYGRCEDTLTTTDFLEVASIPDVSFEIDVASFCEDIEVILKNTSTVDYGMFESWIWDFGDGTTSTEENPSHAYTGLLSPTIVLTGITDKGCEASFESSFSVLPSSIASVGPDQLICIGDEVQLEGTVTDLQPDGSFYWQADPTLSCTDCLMPVASPTMTTEYVFVAVHSNGCESLDTVEVVVIPTPGPELTLDTEPEICLGSDGTIDVVNFNVAYSYIWDTSVPGQDCYVDCPEVVISPAVTTTYYVTVFNEFGCFRSDSIRVEVETSIDDFLVEESGTCENESVDLSITGGLSPQWSDGSLLLCEDCEMVTVSPIQSQYYYASVESELGCSYVDSVFVTLVPAFSADAGADQEICQGEVVTLEAQGFGQARWRTDTGLIVDSLSLSPSFIPQTSGPVSLIMTYYQCVQSDEMDITVYEKADIMTTGDTICVGEIAQLLVEGRADATVWQGIGSTEPDITVDPEVTTEYTVIGSYRTCESDTATAIAYVHPRIDYALEEDFYQIYLNDKIILDPMYDASRSYVYDWTPTLGLDCSDCPDPVIEGLRESVDYQVVITDAETGCQAEDEIRVRFNNECTNSVFHLPNIFSPNGDNTNDFWKMSTSNPEEFISLQVFDRYGNMVFATDVIDQAWDGRFSGGDVVPGVYVYKVNLICPYDRKAYFVVGDVTVIR